MFLEAVYISTYTILVSLGLFALYQSRYYHNKTTSDFTSAKKHSYLRVMWSMYSASVGAWVSVAPSQYASYAGILGLIMYALSSAMPILVISLMSGKMANVSSLNEFIHKRFGIYAQFFVLLLSMLNMGIALVAEYTTIGSIFKEVVHSSPIPTMIIIGLITMCYTSIGGVAVSIVTDQVLAILTMVLLSIAFIYICVFFRPELPPLPDNLGINEAGFSSILTMPLSLISSTIYSEAMWQRVNASVDKKSLYISAVGSSFIVFVVLMFYGLVGFFVTWSDPLVINDPNTIFFHIFGDMQSWIVVIAIIIAAMMSQSAIDSLQNALVAAICSNFRAFKNVNYARFTVFLINIPAIIISLQMYPILNLFLLVNLMTACCLTPLLIGLMDLIYTEWMFLLGCVVAMMSVSAVGIIESDLNFSDGMYWAWFANGYDYKYFLTAILMSTATVMLCIIGTSLITRKTFRIKQ